jgi:hypothetical protein
VRQPFGENLIGGDSWTWIVALDDLDASVSAGATLKYFFRGTNGQKLDLSAAVSDDGTFHFQAASVETAILVGTCAWQLCLFDSDNNRTEIARGSVNVLPDIASSDGTVDLRSWTKRMLDAVCAVLEGRATRAEEEYEISGAGGGRRLRLLKPEELLRLKVDLQAAYNKELVASGQRPSNSNQVRIAFGSRRAGLGGWR